MKLMAKRARRAVAFMATFMLTTTSGVLTQMAGGSACSTTTTVQQSVDRILHLVLQPQLPAGASPGGSCSSSCSSGSSGGSGSGLQNFGQHVQPPVQQASHPTNDVEQAWNTIQATLASAIRQEITQEWVLRLQQIVNGMELPDDEVRDTVECTVLKKIQQLLARIIQGYSPEVQRRASAKFEEIEAALSESAPGAPPSFVAAPPTHSAPSASRTASARHRWPGARQSSWFW